MSEYTGSLTQATFAPTIQKYCEDYGWVIDEITDDIAVLKFEADSDNQQTIVIMCIKNTLEFLAHGGLGFASDDDIPHRLSTMLLRQNSELLLGTWRIQDINGKSVFSLVYDDEMRLMDVNRFLQIVRYLVKTCQKFEQAMESQ